jgi:excisionase family DNA binding protein
MNEKKLTITVEEAARLLGISRGLAYEMVRVGRIPSIRFGKRLVVPKAALEKMINECPSKYSQHANDK